MNYFDFLENNDSEETYITHFEFFVGGYFGPSYFHFINGRKENKAIRFGESEYGNYIEVKDPSVKTDENKGRIVKEIPLTDEEWKNFQEDIKKLKLDTWEVEYDDPDVMDGTHWALIIDYSDNTGLISRGGNDYPKNWKVFLRFLKKYTNENIE